jgi:GGDEF domain-containing protein
MQHPPAILTGAATHLQRIFETDNLADSDLDILLLQVTRIVQQLLRTDLNRLLHILYRIDVEEHAVKQAMLASSEEDIADQIARLIIKRELQKAQTRFKYRSH